MEITYSIAKGNVISFTVDDASEPCMVQPHWPDGTKWGSKAEAEAWAKAYIAFTKDPSADRPGQSPDKPIIPAAELEMPEDHFRALEEAAAAAEAEREAANALAAAQQEAFLREQHGEVVFEDGIVPLDGDDVESDAEQE
jgi:hypothetical protein